MANSVKRIVLCLPGKYYSGVFLYRLCDALARFAGSQYQMRMSQSYDPNIYHVRNLVLGATGDNPDQLPFDGNPYDELLWIDSDVIFTYEDIARLLQHDVPMVSGLYRSVNGNYVCAPVNGTKARDDGLLPVPWNGLGFTKMKSGVVESVGYPWFRPRMSDDGSFVEGDDIAFCSNLREVGIQPLIDPFLIVRHEKLTLL
jgi:hypothetical protein